MSANLEDIIRELAARGEITHFSLTPHGKGWSASFAPAGTFGVSFAEGADPIDTLKEALTKAKLKRRTKVSKPGDDAEPETKVASESDLADLGV